MAKVLSKKQQAIVDCKEDRIIVKACPGSGKTFSVSAKLAKLLSEKSLTKHQGIAILSFTNTACEQILKCLKEDFGIQNIGYPHFVGTIDSFVNNYIFLPYGHLVMGCNKRPEIVGTEYNQWYDYDYSLTKKYPGGISFRDPNYYFDKVSFDIEGNLLRLRPYPSYHFGKKDWDNHYTQKRELKKVIKDLSDAKNRHFAEGKAIQADANFLSLKILKEYPQITESIVNRFPVLIIDEAQDTTAIQMAMIDLVDKAGIKKIMIIGDPDQAIFEWNTADSSLFMEKYNSDSWKKLDLNENRRSSTHICNLVNCFYGNNMTSEAPDKNFQEVPTVVSYSNNQDIQDIQKITNDFIQKCTDLGFTKENIAVVYRGIRFGEQHFGMIDESKDLDEIPWANKHFYVRDFVQGKYLIDIGFYKEGLKLIEKGYFKKNNNLNYAPVQKIKEKIQEIGFRTYRNEIFGIIEKLPSTSNVRLNQWITIANAKLNFSFTVKLDKSNIEIDRIFADKKNQKSASNIYQTIHSVKGMSLEAILIFLKDDSATKNYRNILNPQYNESDAFKRNKDMEEIRVVYVACSRPKKLLWIAVPESDFNLWNEKLLPNTTSIPKQNL